MINKTRAWNRDRCQLVQEWYLPVVFYENKDLIRSCICTSSTRTNCMSQTISVYFSFAFSTYWPKHNHPLFSLFFLHYSILIVLIKPQRQRFLILPGSFILKTIRQCRCPWRESRSCWVHKDEDSVDHITVSHKFTAEASFRSVPNTTWPSENGICFNLSASGSWHKEAKWELIPAPKIMIRSFSSMISGLRDHGYMVLATCCIAIAWAHGYPRQLVEANQPSQLWQSQAYLCSLLLDIHPCFSSRSSPRRQVASNHLW